MTFKIPKMSEAQLREMAVDYVQNKVFTDRHIQPYRRELVLAIFPAMAEACSNMADAREIADNAGLVCAMMSDAIPNKTIRTADENGHTLMYRTFRTCLFIHKDQLPALQKMIEQERLHKKWTRGMKN